MSRFTADRNPLEDHATPSTGVAREGSGRLSLSASLAPIAHFANDGVTSMVPALLPLLALSFDLAPSELALLVSIFAVSTSLPQPFFGSLADRLGARLVGALGLAGSALLMLALSTLPSVAWLGALLAMGGLGSAALHPAGMTLSRAASTANPGLAAALFTAAGMAGGAFGPMVAIAIVAGSGFQGLAWTAAPLMIGAAMLLRFGPPARVSGTPRVAPSLVGLGLLRGPIRRLSFIALCANFTVLTFTSAVPLWLLRERGVDEKSPILGLTLATFSVAAALGGILGGTLTRWLSPSRLVTSSLALSILGLETVLITEPGSAPYFLAIAVAGALLFVHAPLVTARAQELSPGSESAVAGLLLGGTSAAAGVLYALLGPAQGTFGAGAVMAVAFLVLIPATFVATGALGEARGAHADGGPTLALAHCGCAS